MPRYRNHRGHHASEAPPRRGQGQTFQPQDGCQRRCHRLGRRGHFGSPVHYGNPASGVISWFESEWEGHWADASPPVALGAVFATGGGLAQGLEHVLASLQRLLWSFRVQVITPNPTRSGFSSYGAVAVTGTPPWGDNVTHGAIAVPFATAAREFGAQFAAACAEVS